MITIILWIRDFFFANRFWLSGLHLRMIRSIL
jgi:hypothetical protein